MRLPDGTILMHVQQPYDPVKAHEYYMRTRKLKGRKKGTTYAVKLSSGKTVMLSAQQLAEQQAYVAKRIIEIKKRLAELTAKLTEMKSKAKKEAAASKREANKKPTAAEKTKAAKESKEYRKEHKTELAIKSRQASKKEGSKKKSASKDPVAELGNKIAQIKGRLAAAVAQQRALTTASKNS